MILPFSSSVTLLAPIVALVAAYLVCIAVMPVVLRVALRFRLLDFPNLERHRHDRPLPRLGGVAVFVSLVAVTAAGAAFDRREHVMQLLPFMLSCGIGATILFFTGLVDDIRGVRLSGKLLMQMIAAVLVCRAGVRIDVLTLTQGSQLSLGALALPVTVIWIVGLSNAFNLVDGADGLAGGVAAIALVATAISATIVHDATVVWCALALLGAMLGFLRFNFPPARIFLGDSGSLVVGFLLSILTVKGATRSDGAVHFLAPIFALSYPLLDTGISMMRRWLRGEPLSRADGRHIHHQVRALGIGPRQSVLLICGLSSVVALLGLSATFAPPRFTIAVAVGGGVVLCLIFVYGLRWLEYHEFLEAGASVTAAARNGRTVIRDQILARDVAALLRAAGSFDELEELLKASARRFRFVHAELQGRSTRHVADPLPVQVHGSRTWKLEYPVTRHDSVVPYPIMLSIWCATEGTGSPAGAERVAKIIAPSIADWFAVHWSPVDNQEEIAARFPGVYTPVRGTLVVTGDHSLRDAHHRASKHRYIR